jgi:predicted enzyme related to lactoylglutathione lyase
MTKQENYAPGAPCWVDTWQPDLKAATRFYGALLGWQFDEPVVVAETRCGYRTARLDGRRVAGVGQAPPSAAAVWSTSIRVERLEPMLDRVKASGGAHLAGPVRVGSDGRLAIVADPEGVAFGLWEPDRRIGAELVGAPGAWAMSSLHTTDPVRATAFYGGVFRWELEQATGAAFAECRLEGRLVAVLSGTDGASVPAHWSVNIAVGDVDAVCRQAPELGGAVLVAPFDTEGFRNAVVADPQGGVIALSTPGG